MNKTKIQIYYRTHFYTNTTIHCPCHKPITFMKNKGIHIITRDIIIK